MEKAIEIKRRAQRCILNGDLDGALAEYEKLVAAGDSDPYHSVLLADLLYKKGDHGGAARRYLEAVDGYERAGLVKNAIAVCKKMARLSLSPSNVLLRLAGLHALDGLATESSLYYMQHAELVLRSDELETAIDSLHLAFQVCPDNVKALERLAEVQERAGNREDAAQTLLEAANQYDRLAQVLDATRCRGRADQLEPGVVSRPPAQRGPVPAAEVAPAAPPPAPAFVEPTVAEDPIPTRAAEPAAPGEELPLEIETAFQSANPTMDTRGGSPARPGLVPPVAAVEEEETEADEDGGLPEVSRILKEAQALFQTGQQDAATNALVRAAQAYDRLGRFENAAAIYRTLSQATEASLQVMMLWLKNCQRRDDRSEASRVACDLGDRALKSGDMAGAREWFERARAFDEGNDVAQRRLKRLNEPAGDAGVATATAPPLEPPPAPPPTPRPMPTSPHGLAPEPELERAMPVSDGPPLGARPPREGFIHVTVDRDEKRDLEVELDLGALIEEFQRGLEEQVTADAQSHYDLGMSYREMGLLDEAIHSFEVASADPMFRVRASELIGRSLLDQGDFDGAVTTLRATLELAELNPDSVWDVRYQLGLALEAAGRADEALREFEKIYGAAPSYPQVASKIRALRHALERP